MGFESLFGKPSHRTEDEQKEFEKKRDAGIAAVGALGAAVAGGMAYSEIQNAHAAGAPPAHTAEAPAAAPAVPVSVERDADGKAVSATITVPAESMRHVDLEQPELKHLDLDNHQVDVPTPER